MFRLFERLLNAKDRPSHCYLDCASIRFRSASVQSQMIFLSSSERRAFGCIGKYDGRGILPSVTSSHISCKVLFWSAGFSFDHSE